MKVLSIDPGRTYAMVLFEDGEQVEGVCLKYESPSVFYAEVSRLAQGVDVIVHGSPVYRAKVIAFHSKQIGIIELIADIMGVGAVPILDNMAKRVVLGNGRAEKEDIIKRYEGLIGFDAGKIQEHIADCFMFHEYFLQLQNEDNS